MTDQIKAHMKYEPIGSHAEFCKVAREFNEKVDELLRGLIEATPIDTRRDPDVRSLKTAYRDAVGLRGVLTSLVAMTIYNNQQILLGNADEGELKVQEVLLRNFKCQYEYINTIASSSSFNRGV